MKRPLETLTSPSNPLIKSLKGLERKKERQASGLFLAEGARLVGQGLANGWTPDTLVVAAAVAERAHISALMEKADAAGARVVLVPERLMSKVTHKDNAQSVIATFRQRKPALGEIKTSGEVNDIAPGSNIAALYEVRDPGNLGTIIRTLDCAGSAGLILIGTCCDPYSFEAVRASMGSIFDLPVVNASYGEFDAWRRKRGLKLAAASVNGIARHDLVQMQQDTIILMGNEQAGLPPEVEADCEDLVLIPMRGGADSLNLAQATAIMVYEAWRQRNFQ
ncbi:MAG: RNA methyltransferase [Hyphomonas sp.]|nr:RNA methyltransferase [Hyphomonas sp.]